MKKVITFILLTVFTVSSFANNVVFLNNNVLENCSFVDNSELKKIEKHKMISISEDYTPIFANNGIFDFPNSITGDRVSNFNEYFFFFQCGQRPGKNSTIFLFDSKYKTILKKTIKPGQGPFNLNYIGNCFFIDEHTVGLIFTFKIIAFDFSKGIFKEYISQKLPEYKLTYTSAKMLNWGNDLVLFNFSFQPKNMKNPWLYCYKIKNKKVKLDKIQYLEKNELKKIAGEIWDLNNSNIDKSSQKFFELWPKPTDIKVVKGKEKGDYYFYNPYSKIILKGNAFHNILHKYTSFDVKENVFLNYLFFNKLRNEIWMALNTKNDKPEITVLSKDLQYKYTMKLKLKEKFNIFNIYKIMMLNEKDAIVVCALEKEKNSGVNYKIVKIEFENL